MQRARTAPPIPKRPAAPAAGAKARGRSRGKKSANQRNESGYGPDPLRQVGVAASYSNRMVTREPRITTSRNSKRICHRELVLTSVPGSTGFALQSTLRLNPGLAATFPWLSVECQNWTQYTVHGLTAEWIPILPTNSAGDVLISPNYNASKPAPTTEQQAANNKDSVEDSVWKNIVVPLDPKGMMGLAPRRFIRSSNVAGDIKTFDVGNLFICTNNEANTNAAGKLYLAYDIEFFEPEDDPQEYTTPQQTSDFVQATAQTFTSTVATPINFSTSVYDPLGVGPAVSGVFTPPAGCYRLEAQGTFNNATLEGFTAQLRVIKNGASLATAVQSENTFGTSLGTTPWTTSLSILAIVPCNGTDTFSIDATLTGATGPLTSVAGGCQLLVSLA